MNSPEETLNLQLRPRQQESIVLNIPKDTLEGIKKVAASRNMSLEALLKFYIGQGLREDLEKLFSSQILESTAKVLAKHFSSEAEVNQILEEINAEISQ